VDSEVIWRSKYMDYLKKIVRNKANDRKSSFFVALIGTKYLEIFFVIDKFPPPSYFSIRLSQI
jgi:hypothetical protein